MCKPKDLIQGKIISSWIYNKACCLAHLFSRLSRFWLVSAPRQERDCIKCLLANLIGVIVDGAEAGLAIVCKLVPLFAT